MNMFEIAHSLQRQYGAEQWCLYRGKHLMNFVDNHDVTRIATILNNKNHLPLTYGLMMGMPGIPCIYYGSEWGEPGEKAPDNDYALRPCFEKPKPNALTELIQKLIRIRQKSDALCSGSYRNVVLTNHQLIFERATESEKVLVAINASDTPYTACHGDLTGSARELLSGDGISLAGSLETIMLETWQPGNAGIQYPVPSTLVTAGDRDKRKWGHRQMQMGTPVNANGDVHLLQKCTSPFAVTTCYFTSTFTISAIYIV